MAGMKNFEQLVPLQLLFSSRVVSFAITLRETFRKSGAVMYSAF